MKTDKAYYFSWVRKGLACHIAEKDAFGNTSAPGLALVRPSFPVLTRYDAASTDEEKGVQNISAEREILLYGPGDILGIHANEAVMKVNPARDTEGFPVDFFPYVEFWEPDFAWRYTPAAPDGERLRPWLALLVFETDGIDLEKPASGLPYLSFKGNQEEYETAFLPPADLWKTAHAQGQSADRPDFCRLLALRKSGHPLRKNTAYTACLVPAFETGRLRGRGFSREDIRKTVAQTPSWDMDLKAQGGRPRGLDFPVYHSWQFTSGEESFDTLVRNLTVAKSDKSGIAVDVTRMGNGLDLRTLNLTEEQRDAFRKTIIMPTAAQPNGVIAEREFPRHDDSKEKELYGRMVDLLSRNPVFGENAALIQGAEDGTAVGDEDPWVVPPVYGAKHGMATELIPKNGDRRWSQAWIENVNLDIHYRAAAGLGRKVVMEHQEEFVNRAWKQVEAVQALNLELYNRLLSLGANESLRRKTVGAFGQGNAFLASMMRYLQSMKNARTDVGNKQVSLSNILKNRNIAEGFASAAFQHRTDALAKIVSNLDTKTLLEHVLNRQTVVLTQNLSQNLTERKRLLSSFMLEFSEFVESLYRHYISPFTVNPYLDLIIQGVREDGNLVVAWNGDRVPQGRVEYVETLRRIDLEVSRPMSGRGRPLNEDDTHKALKVDLLFKYENFQRTFMPDSPIGWYGSYFYSRRSEKKAPEGELKNMQMLKDFFDKGYDKHCTLGFYFNPGRTENSDFGSRCKDLDRGLMTQDVLISLYKIKRTYDASGYVKESKDVVFSCFRSGLVGLPSDLFVPLFSTSKPIVHYGDLYFVNLEKLTSRIRQGDRALAKHVRYAYLLPVVGIVVMGEGECTPKQKYSVKYHSHGGIGIYTYDGSYVDLGFDRSAICETRQIKSASDRSLYQSYMAKAENYLLGTPSFILVDVDGIPNEIEEISSISDFTVQVMKSTESPYIGYIKSVCQIFDLLKDNPKAPQEPAPPEQAGDNAQVEALKEKFNDTDEAWAQMEAVAARYYAEFYADTETGRKLRGKYIDELLQSRYPILAYPFFPEPTQYYLRMIDTDFVLPGGNALPDDSVSLFLNNEIFEEAYLCGMNTEMGRELLWREYPTDQRGSYFRKFWDADTSVEDIRSDHFFDIKPVHTWEGPLGSNHPEDKTGLLIFAIKGRLMRVYPSTKVRLRPAVCDSAGTLSINLAGQPVEPVMESFLQEDIFLVGFKKDFRTVLGNPAKSPADYGYFLCFEESVDDLNYQETPDSIPNAGVLANAYRNRPSIFGKHLSLFI